MSQLCKLSISRYYLSEDGKLLVFLINLILHAQLARSVKRASLTLAHFLLYLYSRASVCINHTRSTWLQS